MSVIGIHDPWLGDTEKHEIASVIDSGWLSLGGSAGERFEAGLSEALWMGVSVILPGGHTSLDASPVEKHCARPTLQRREQSVICWSLFLRLTGIISLKHLVK